MINNLFYQHMCASHLSSLKTIVCSLTNTPKFSILFLGDINNMPDFHDLSDPSTDQHRHELRPTHLTMDPKVPSSQPYTIVASKFTGYLESNTTGKRNLGIKLLHVTTSIYESLPNFIHKSFVDLMKTHISYILSRPIYKKSKFPMSYSFEALLLQN